MITNPSNIESSIANLSVANQYLNVVENQLKQTIESENKHIVILNNEEIDWKTYEKMTISSDFRIIVPVLFNLYQGIELIMKGLLLINKEDYPTNNKGHKLSLLYQKVKLQDNIPMSIKEYLSYFLEPKEGYIQSFLNKNNKKLDNISEILRYPTDKSFLKIYDYTNLKYQERKMIPYIEEILVKCHKLRIEVVRYARSKDNVK